MKAETHIGFKEHHGVDDLYDGHFDPTFEGSPAEVITYLESFLYLDCPEIEPLKWEGSNGWFYAGGEAGKMLRDEIDRIRALV